VRKHAWLTTSHPANPMHSLALMAPQLFEFPHGPTRKSHIQPIRNWFER